MYKKMLIPLDRSELAEVVFPHAREIAGRLGLQVVLLHVASREEHDRVSSFKGYLDSKSEALLNQAYYVQRSSGKPTKDGNVRVTSVLTVGNPPEEILQYVEENSVDLVLMATHGRSGITRWALGSVADKVLRRSSVPVWLVRAAKPESGVSAMWPNMKVLVPLDGSTMAESVLPHVEALSRQRGIEMEVTLMRVIEHQPANADRSAEKAGPGKDARRRKDDTRAECEAYLADIAGKLSSSAVSVRSEVLAGDPSEQIIEYANKNRSGLVLMATHGRSGVGRWAFGSVADRVLRRSSRPLLLVRVARAEW